jgi:hypothetical protein
VAVGERAYCPEGLHLKEEAMGRSRSREDSMLCCGGSG